MDSDIDIESYGLIVDFLHFSLIPWHLWDVVKDYLYSVFYLSVYQPYPVKMFQHKYHQGIYGNLYDNYKMSHPYPIRALIVHISVRALPVRYRKYRELNCEEYSQELLLSALRGL